MSQEFPEEAFDHTKESRDIPLPGDLNNEQLRALREEINNVRERHDLT